MNSDDTIQAYIKQILKIQEQQKQGEGPLTKEEMTQMAADLGMTEDDLAMIDRHFNDYLVRGKGYSKYEDWDSAIEELKQAVMLNPVHVEALFALANAYKHRWLLKRNKQDLNSAKSYGKRVLQINAGHDPALKLMSQLNTKTIWTSQRPSSTHQRQRPSMVGNSDLKPYDTIGGNHLVPDRKLRKSRDDKKIFGVCGGIANYFGIDPTLVRIGFVAGTFITGAATIPIYLVLNFVLPDSR